MSCEIFKKMPDGDIWLAGYDSVDAARAELERLALTSKEECYAYSVSKASVLVSTSQLREKLSQQADRLSISNQP